MNQFRHYRHTKLLLIDIIGNVFSSERPLYRDFNATADNSWDNLLVLTILTQKFKFVLNSEYHLVFSRYLNLKSIHAAWVSTASAAAHNESSNGNESFCDFMLPHKRNRNYDEKSFAFANVTACKRKLKENCRNLTNDEIKSFCDDEMQQRSGRSSSNGIQLNDNTFNKQLVFSEHFNLFDFITSIMRVDDDDGDDDEKKKSMKKNKKKNVSNHQRHHQFDFIVLDFKSILNATNADSIVSWRPLMILEQNQIDKSAFTMHHALSESDVFDEWIDETPFKWKCSAVCWGIIAGIFLIIVGLIFFISLFAGIAAR